MAQRIPTRLGDGSLVELTRAEIEADLHAGSEAAVKRAKVEPLGAGRARPPARHLHLAGQVQLRGLRRRGGAELRRVRQRRHRGADPRAGRVPEPPRRGHDRALAPRLLVQGGAHRPLLPDAAAQGRAAADGDPAQLRGDAGPGPLLAAGRPRAELVGAHAAGQDRRGPGGAARGRRAPREGHVVRRRGDGRRRRRRHRLRHRRRLGRRRPAGHAAHGPQGPRHVAGHRRRDRAGRRARARHARPARVRRGPAGRPVAARPAPAPARPPAPPSSGRRSTSTRPSRSPGTPRAPARSSSR